MSVAPSTYPPASKGRLPDGGGGGCAGEPADMTTDIPPSAVSLQTYLTLLNNSPFQSRGMSTRVIGSRVTKDRAFKLPQQAYALEAGYGKGWCRIREAERREWKRVGKGKVAAKRLSCGERERESGRRCDETCSRSF